MNSTNWKIEFKPDAQDQLEEIDKTHRSMIAKFIYNRLVFHPNPIAISDPLVGKYIGFRRFRVGDYRLIADVNNLDKIITLYQIGHRREIYK